MTTRKPAQWKDVPSSGDLAGLVRCEAEFVWERNTQVMGATRERQAKAVRGERAHLQTQLDMERHHNRPRPAAARAPAAASVRGPAPVGAARPAPPPEIRPPPAVASAPPPGPPPAPTPSLGSTGHQARPAPHIPPSSSDRRCFVASAVYGLDDPRTEELRRFRDTQLQPSKFGRAAVRLYYRLSPALVLVLDWCPVLRRLARAALDLVRSRISERSAQ